MFNKLKNSNNFETIDNLKKKIIDLADIFFIIFYMLLKFYCKIKLDKYKRIIIDKASYGLP